QQGDGGGVFGDSQFTSTLSVNFHFPKIPRRTCFLSSLFGRATKFFLPSIVKTLIETRALIRCNAECQRSKTFLTA
ncbi:hypothetical protein SPM21_03890, partial [Enterobacter hormaechei subsp. xiangfangensis]